MSNKSETNYVCKQCIKNTLTNISEAPSMEEEYFCISCLSRGKNTSASCLYKGQPSCSQCIISKNTENKSKLINTPSELRRYSSLHKHAASVEPIQENNSKKVRSHKLVLDASSFEKTESFDKTKIFDNKIMSLFSPKPSSVLSFRGIKNPLEKLYGSLEAIFDNPGNITIHLPITFEASKNAPRSLSNSNLFEKGNYLFIFLDNTCEMLFGFLMCNTSDRNHFKFFKVNAEKDTNKIEYYSEILSGIKYEKTSNELIHNYFCFNMNNYVLNCENKKLASFLTVFNIILYSNISYLKIYDMC
jgi:hypothetical protein